MGYGGTKEEMERLLADAEKVSGIKYDISSYADVVSAIHVMQEEMGIAGTTALEASTTISGSLASLGASWTNLVAGFANPDADIGLLIDQMVQSAITAFDNLAPAVMTAIQSIGGALTQIAPIITQYLPQLISTVLPQLINTAMILVNGVVDALPAILNTIIPVLPEVFQLLIDAIIEVLPMLIEVAIQIVQVVGQGLMDNLDLLIDSAIAIVTQLAESLTEPSNIESLLNSAIKIIQALYNGLIRNAPMILSAIGTVMQNILTGIGNALPNIADFLLSGVGSIFTMMFEDVGAVLNGIGSIFSTVFDGIKNHIKNVADFIKSIFKGDITGAFNALGNIAFNLLNTVTGVFGNILNTAKDLVNNLLKAFKFKWELPKIKLPKISVSGGEAPYGIGGVGSLPKFSIQWMAQGYQDAMLLDKATIFGMDKSGRLLGGGEKTGTEAVVGTDLLMGMIQSVVRSELTSLQLPVYLDGDKMVGYLAPRIDNELGRLSNLSAKGAY